MVSTCNQYYVRTLKIYKYNVTSFLFGGITKEEGHREEMENVFQAYVYIFFSRVFYIN
jgi:hypothetical protein